jgi:hypothetical protein
MPPAQPKFKTEAELCAAFIAWAGDRGWTAYAETADWDILLVNRADGTQCGVQAKLHFNATLMRQVLPTNHYDEKGPDHRAILLPKKDQEVVAVCQAIGIEHIAYNNDKRWTAVETSPFHFGHSNEEFTVDLSNLRYDWNPAQREDLPEFVPDCPAGASAPLKLTHWKIQALKICAILELEGEITTKRIKETGVSQGRWIIPEMGWLTKKPDGKRGEYVRGPRLNFDKQHPIVYQQILEQMKEAK